MGRFRRAVPLLVALVGCADGGMVELHLELPADESLDPMDSRASRLALTAYAGSDVVHRAETDLEAGAALELGRLPLGEALTFELSALSAADRVIGFGRADSPTAITADDLVEVSIPVRRPYVYLGGADDLVAVDATLEPGLAYESGVPLGAAVEAVAATADGRFLVVATDAGVVTVATSDHTAASAVIPVDAPTVELAVSADGRWAAASHATGFSLIDLEARSASFTAGKPTAAVTFIGDRVWLLQDRLDNIFCQGTSSMLGVRMDDPSDAVEIELSSAASDIAADRASGTLFVALGCAGHVAAIDTAAADPVPTVAVEIEGPTAIAVARERLWVMGHINGEDAHLIAVSTTLDGDDLRRLDLPTLEERAVARELAAPGQNGHIQMTADLASAFDLSVLPDGRHIAILVAAGYNSQPSGNSGGVPIIPNLTMVTYEYQLVDLSTGLGAQRLRTSCAIEWEPGAILDDFDCGRAPGQDLSERSFVPTRLSALFGER